MLLTSTDASSVMRVSSGKTLLSYGDMVLYMVLLELICMVSLFHLLSISWFNARFVVKIPSGDWL